MDESRLQKIEDYLANQLSEEEARLFELEIQNDPDLAKEVALAKQVNHHLSDTIGEDSVPDNEYTEKIREFVQSEEATKVREAIAKAGKEYAPAPKKGFWNNSLFRVAAIAVLFLTVAGVVYFGNNNTGPGLYAAYYSEKDVPAIIQRDETTDALENAVIKFQDENYQEALQEFEAYLSSNPENINPNVYVYTGLSHMNLGHEEESLMEFDNLINSDALDSSKGLWFKALALLNFGEKNKAKEVLEQLVSNTSNFNFELANELLGEL